MLVPNTSKLDKYYFGTNSLMFLGTSRGRNGARNKSRIYLGKKDFSNVQSHAFRHRPIGIIISDRLYGFESFGSGVLLNFHKRFERFILDFEGSLFRLFCFHENIQ